MFKNTKFAFYAVVFLVLGVLYNFFFSGLQTDHLNVLTPYLAKTYGWTNMQITNPVTIAGFVTIILYLVCGAALVKFGVRKILIPSTLLLAVFTIGIALSGANYAMYAVCLFLVRLLVVPLQMGSFMLAANWFIKYRGRVLGIITAGAPLFSVVGISVLTYLANTIGIKQGYIILGIIILVMGLATLFFLKDTPEDAGLFPDGAETAPKSEENKENETITVKQLLKRLDAWQFIVSFGIIQCVMLCMMSFMAVRYNSLTAPGHQGPPLFVEALPFLSVGAIAGIPMSFVLGWIDDKLGSIKAVCVLNLLFFLAVIPLTIMPVGGSHVLMAVWAFGVACMTGGFPTLHPSTCSYIFGRHLYQAANKWIMTIQAIPFAFGIAFMASMNDHGLLNLAYYINIGLLIVAFVVNLSMLRIPDANAADRDYGQKAKKADAGELSAHTA